MERSRTRGGWNILAGVVLGGHFVLAFLVLLIRDFKRSVAAMASLGALLLVMHYLDVYWIVMPSAPHTGVAGPWLDVGALMVVAGVASVTWSLRRRGEPAVVRGDPLVGASLQYSAD